jgi:hypothetical protein
MYAERMRVLAAAILLVDLGEPANARQPCGRELSEQTESAVSRFRVSNVPADGPKAWADFKELVDKHGRCDDGWYGEMFSDPMQLRRRGTWREFEQTRRGGAAPGQESTLAGLFPIVHPLPMDVPGFAAL